MYTPLDAEQAAVDAADAAARAVASAQAQAQAAQAVPGLRPVSATATTAQAATTATAQPGGSSNATVYQWLVAWLVVILFGILIARTRIGYTMLYYMAALSLLFLLLTNSSWIAAAVKPITGPTPQEEKLPVSISERG